MQTISQLCLLRGPRNYDIPVAMSTYGTKILFLNFIFDEKKPGLLQGEITDARAGTRKYKMSLEYLIISEIKEVLKKKQLKR